MNAPADTAVSPTTPLQPESYRYWIDEHVRFADLDMLGHVNNVAFLVYIEHGRASMLHEAGMWGTDSTRQNVIARVELDYRHEIRFPSQLRVGSAVRNIGRSSFVLGTGIFVDGACAAVATTVHVRVDTTTRRSTALTEEERARLGRYLISIA